VGVKAAAAVTAAADVLAPVGVYLSLCSRLVDHLCPELTDGFRIGLEPRIIRSDGNTVASRAGETHCSIGGFLIGLTVQSYPDRKTSPCVVSNDLNAVNGLAPGPLYYSRARIFHVA
jgi:hypothetical protein